MLWMLIVNCGLVWIVRENGGSKDAIFNIGPNPDLFILAVCIDTPAKYCVIVAFCLINSGVRTIHHNILQSWIINTVQDEKAVMPVNSIMAYEVSFVSTIFTWFDFFMYMNILMSQIDLFVIEITMDLIMVSLVTKYYLSKKKKNFEMNSESDIRYERLLRN
jgi:hypothetical protein